MPRNGHWGFSATPAVPARSPRLLMLLGRIRPDYLCWQHWPGHSAKVSLKGMSHQTARVLLGTAGSASGTHSASSVRQTFALPIVLARTTLKHFAQDGEAIEGTGKTAVRSGLDDGFDHLLPG